MMCKRLPAIRLQPDQIPSKRKGGTDSQRPAPKQSSSSWQKHNAAEMRKLLTEAEKTRKAIGDIRQLSAWIKKETVK